MRLEGRWAAATIALAIGLLGCGNDSTSGTAGSGGMAGTGGMAGAGGSAGVGGRPVDCVDDIGPRPTLTAQPTLAPETIRPGDTITVGIEPSEETRFLRVAAFDSIGVLGEAEVVVSGTDPLSVRFELAPIAPVGEEHYIGFFLCDDVDCLEDPTPDSVSYTLDFADATTEDRYLIIVIDGGIDQPDINKTSCYDLLSFRPVSDP